MRFGFVQKDTLPRSAWLACVRRDDDTIELLHGSSVEPRGDFFFEGAWDGEFASGGFDRSGSNGSAGRASG